MIAARTQLSVVCVLVAVLVTTGAPLGAQALYRVCAAKEHDCAQVARLTQCCCCDGGDASKQPGVTEGRVNFTPEHSVIGIFTFTIEMPSLGTTSRQIDTSSPDERPPDFPVLFADLRL